MDSKCKHTWNKKRYRRVHKKSKAYLEMKTIVTKICKIQATP